ncbi:MAG TPA: glycosyltransferase [Puia sp.]|nr:glycosyltransferase [Puia sp.]
MNSRPAALVILTPAIPADESPVNWVTTQQLFIKTVKENYPQGKVIVLSFYYPYSAAVYEWHGIPVTSFNGTRYRKVRRVVFWRNVWKKLTAIRRDYEITGLFSFWCGECALIGHYYGIRYGIRHYCWLCGQDARKSNKLVKFIRPRPDELIAMSDFLVDEFERNHGIRPRYRIPNGIDPREFVPVTESPDLPTKPAAMPAERSIDILGVGTLSRFKQYHLLVEIITSLRSSLPAIKGLHCGEGEEKERIQTLIREAGIEDHLCLRGETPHREVLGYMQRTKLLLHTSDYEGFGVVCLEALYAGAHVISFVQPMKQEIPHWHVVHTMEEMRDKAKELLLAPHTEYTPVCPYLMEDTVKEVLSLFDDDYSRVIGQNASYHNQAADSYDQTMDKDPANKIIRQRVKEKLCSLLPSGRVLDFGGGTGLDLEWLTTQSYQVIFCEPSVPMREKAIHYNDTILQSDRITFLDTDKTDFATWHRELPFTQKCDAVLSDFGALNYIPDIELLFNNMARVLKPGGHFVLLILKLNLTKRWRWHRRNTVKSLLFRTPYILYIPYDQPSAAGDKNSVAEEGRQTVFVHSVKEIREAAAPYFNFCKEESLEAYDFTLIHLIRNEKQD